MGSDVISHWDDDSIKWLGDFETEEQAKAKCIEQIELFIKALGNKPQ